MFGYRSHVHTLYWAAVAVAARIVLSMSQLTEGDDPAAMGRLQAEHRSLEKAVDDFLSALPQRLPTPHNDQLHRHVHFIGYYVDRGQPQNCMHDPVLILERDLPERLRIFDEWYDQHSLLDRDFADRMKPLVVSGNINSAVRDAWPIFKTRMVETFNLPRNLDGNMLAKALFGAEGATAGVLPNETREGYLNLFKGLYTLSRNVTIHNDHAPNPLEAEAVLVMIGVALAKIELARTEQPAQD